MIVLCLVASLVRADDGKDVVTDVPPVVTATMQLTSSTDGCFVWTVEGKVRKAFRGPGADVKLVCEPYATLGSGSSTVVFPQPSNCDGDYCPPRPPNVDPSTGNFSFQVVTCGDSPQLDPSYLCVFAAHVDAVQCKGDRDHDDQGRRCRKGDGSGGGDPNGSAPCSGSFCPDN